MPRAAHRVFQPIAGTKLDQPDQFLREVYSADGSQNMELFDDYLRSRLGLAKAIADSVGAPFLRLGTFKTLTQTLYFYGCTTTDIFELDLAAIKPMYRTPIYMGTAAAAGVCQVVSGSAVVRGGFLVDDADDDPVAWVTDQGANAVVTRETTTVKENSVSVKIALGAGATTGLVAHHVITALNLAAYDSLGFWFRSTVALNAGDFKILLDNTAACTSPLESIDLPAIAANTWTWVNVAMADPSLCTAIVAVGLNQVVDKGAMDCFLDFLVAGDLAGQAAVGDKVRIDGVNDGAFASQAWYTVLTVDSDTQLTLTANYAQSSEDQQPFVVRLLFNGGSTDYWDAASFTDNTLGQILVLTNNAVDPLVYWTGTGQALTLGGSPPKCKYLAVLNNFLFLLWCVVVGDNQPHQVEWSAPGDAQTWPGTSVEYLLDTEGEISGRGKVGNYLVVTKELGFYLGRYVGGDFLFDFEPRDVSHGCIAPWSVVEAENGLFYLGDDNRFHYWDGVRDQAISDDILPFTRNLDPDGQRNTYGIHYKSRKQIRWFVSVGDTPFTHVLVYNYGLNPPGWQVWAYDAAAHLGVPGLFELENDLYVDDVTWGSYYLDEQIGYWDDRTFLANASVPFYGGTDGYLRQADIGTDDDGTDILSIFRSAAMDYGLPGHAKRLHRFEPWLGTQGTGTVAHRMQRDDDTSFGSSRSFSLVEAGKDVTKPSALIDLSAHVVTHELRTTSHWSLLGFITHLSQKRRRIP